ncbi:MAG TPA: ring-cleaving dioxygenase [Bauldia sp.]|nr:ring-cleaving dioxygenase [Bauldia sp.]
MQLGGIHHLTAISANARGNVDFYTRQLGLRLVKKTVNQDDVTAYHLFYADGIGSPGSDLTFFDWPAAPEKRGTNSITRTALRVAGDTSLEWWAKRLTDAGISNTGVKARDNRATIQFEDPEGQRLALVDDGGVGAAHPWEESNVPIEHQVRGLGPITISVPDLKPTDAILTRVMNMSPVREYGASADGSGATVHVYKMGEGGPAAELHVAVEPTLSRARSGRGGAHHVAFRTADQAGYDGWVERLRGLGVPNSGKVDRFYFQSLYFREPNGILFEIATDGPGFASDEPLETMGRKLSLPPFLEERRAEIEAGLKPL